MQDKSEFEKKYNAQPTESLLDKYNVQRLNSVNEADTSFIVTNETGNQSIICTELLPDKLGRTYYSVHYENKLTGEYKCVASRVSKYTCEKYVEKCFVEEPAEQEAATEQTTVTEQTTAKATEKKTMASNRNNEINSQIGLLASVVCMSKKDAMSAIDDIYHEDHKILVWTNESGRYFCPVAEHPDKKHIVAVMIYDHESSEFNIWASNSATNNVVMDVVKSIIECEMKDESANTVAIDEPAEQVAEPVEAETQATAEPATEPATVEAEEDAEPEQAEELRVTHSSMHCFMGCRQKYDYRYNKRIVPKDTPAALTFGSAVHAGLEMWFKTGIQIAAINAAGLVDGLDDASRVKAEELVRKYTELYAEEPFEVVEVEHTFTQKARHPKSNELSNRIVYTGRIDGIIEKNGELWILEHKTASVADDAYFDCKDFDDQIAFYAIAMSEELSRPVVGALYDVILKPRHMMSKGETDAEYEARVAASKTGKIKRKEAETVDAFRARVAGAIDDFSFMRRWIRFDPVDLIRKRAAFWSASNDMANGDIYQNTCACNSGYGACEYRHLCKARGDLSKCAEHYESREAHSELIDKDSAE